MKLVFCKLPLLTTFKIGRKWRHFQRVLVENEFGDVIFNVFSLKMTSFLTDFECCQKRQLAENQLHYLETQSVRSEQNPATALWEIEVSWLDWKMFRWIGKNWQKRFTCSFIIFQVLFSQNKQTLITPAQLTAAQSASLYTRLNPLWLPELWAHWAVILSVMISRSLWPIDFWVSS